MRLLPVESSFPRRLKWRTVTHRRVPIQRPWLRPHDFCGLARAG